MKAYIEEYVPQMRDEVVNLKLRPEDVDELRASSGKEPEEIIAESIDASNIVYVIKLEGRILGVFGVSEHPSSTSCGIPWLLMTREVAEKVKYQFLLGCRHIIRFFHAHYPKLVNLIDTRQVRYIKWLEWLGFTVDKNQQYFLYDQSIPFYLFYKEDTLSV